MDNLSAAIGASRIFPGRLTAFIGFIQRRLSSPQGVAESIGMGWRLESDSGGGLRRNTHILLNLVLSMLAAIQAPIILMSQNRQAYKDRLSAEHDYEVNLKAELEIIGLHEKVDSLREHQWSELIAIQQEQLRLLRQLIEDLKKDQRTTS
jgi:hypothetical protein